MDRESANEMEVTTKHESGATFPSYRTTAAIIKHPNGLEITITETKEGFKVTETGRNDARLSVRPSSGNSITIEP